MPFALVSVALVPSVLAAADFGSPLFWAAFIGWVLSVVLHEFAHGAVAYWGGDYTIRERGGLSLNPLQYVDPLNSLILPAVFLALGGVPLPGGVTYVRRDLIRTRAWQSAMSLAGPAMNGLIFLALAAAVHPKMGWVDPTAPARDWLPAQRVVAALAFLNLYGAILNLIPLPPLDGFNAISPYLDRQTRLKLTMPPANIISLVILYVLVTSPGVKRQLYDVTGKAFELIGYDAQAVIRVRAAFAQTLFGQVP
ncbi:MAG: peptidase family [Phycisphaerales bacterium]|nr:peptidase family [Phycisphaerales bacterium]